MSTNETRSNGSILQLPTEVFHLLFDYLDPETIFNSIAPVCQIIRDKVTSYNRLKLYLSHDRQALTRFLAQVIERENVISISLCVNNKKDPSNVNLFFSSYAFEQFVRLKSLKLIQINGSEFDQFFDHIIRYQLKSLAIVFSSEWIDQIHRTIQQLSTVISQIGLEDVDLTLSNGTLSDEIVLKSISIVLKRLKIAHCTFEQFHLIISSCFNLKTLIIDNFICSRELDRTFLPLAWCVYPRLTSLTLKSSSSEFDQLCSLLSFTPSLVYLQLNIKRCQSPDILSGHAWKKFIEDRLSHLKVFRFFFTYQIQSHCNVPSLRSIVNSFESPFWINEKHWIIVCDYVLKSSEINLYMRALPIHDDQIVIRSTSSIDDYQLIRRKQINLCESLFDEQLITLDLSQMCLNDFGLSLLADVLNHKTMLTTLKYHGSALSKEKISFIAEIIATNETITTLDFHFRQGFVNDVPRRKSRRIYSEFVSTTFNVFGMSTTCATDSSGIHSEVGFPKCTTEWPDSRYLTNSSEFRESHVGDEGASGEYVAPIGNALITNKTLKVLCLRSSKINELGAKHLANALENNSTLITLDCQETQIGDEGVKHLANALKINSTVTTLNLAGNWISQLGVEHLANALKTNQTLTTLCLGGNPLKTPDFERLFNDSKQNQTLTRLILEKNQSGSIGIGSLLKKLNKKTPSTTKDLLQDEIGSAGCEYLTKLLQKNPKLRTLNLELDGTDDQEVQHYARVMQIHQTLRRLDLPCKQIEKLAAQYLIDALEKEQTNIECQLKITPSTDQHQMDLLNQLIHRNRKLL